MSKGSKMYREDPDPLNTAQIIPKNRVEHHHKRRGRKVRGDIDRNNEIHFENQNENVIDESSNQPSQTSNINKQSRK